MAEGGGGAWEQQRNHYNSHVRDLPTQEALLQRSEGPAQELKNFHNHVKRQLIMRFAYKQDRLLDLCCGRGGDLHKWREAQIGYVKGLDISEREVEEARRRYSEMRDRKRGPGGPLCEFEAVNWLGERLYEEPGAGPASYGIVTCMFALHYFFVTEGSLRTFLANVAANLRHGGYFVGTIPSGRRVLDLLGGKPELRTPMLRLVRRWKDPLRPPRFGAGYICDIADTVTSSLQGATEGSLEYLVDLPTLERAAADAGLVAVRDYMDPVLGSCFQEEDLDAPFKHFRPFFLNSLQLDKVPGKPGGPSPPTPQPPSSLELASSLFAAFVFQKVEHPDELSLPMAPECQFMQDRTQQQQQYGFRGGHGGGGPIGMGMGPHHPHPGPMGHPGLMGNPHPGHPHHVGPPPPMMGHGPTQGMGLLGAYGAPPGPYGGGGHGYGGGGGGRGPHGKRSREGPVPGPGDRRGGRFPGGGPGLG